MKNANAATVVQKVKAPVSKFRTRMANAWLVMCLALIPSIASANPIVNAVDWVVDLLTNGLARTAAILALVVIGYMAWAGRLTAAVAGMAIVGIVLVFGSASLVDLISGAVS